MRAVSPSLSVPEEAGIKLSCPRNTTLLLSGPIQASPRPSHDSQRQWEAIKECPWSDSTLKFSLLAMKALLDSLGTLV